MNLSNKNRNQSLLMKVVCKQATPLEKEHFFTEILHKPTLRKKYWELKTLDRQLSENKNIIWGKTPLNETPETQVELDDCDIDDSFILAYSKAQNELKNAINLNI